MPTALPAHPYGLSGSRTPTPSSSSSLSSSSCSRASCTSVISETESICDDVRWVCRCHATARAPMAACCVREPIVASSFSVPHPLTWRLGAAHTSTRTTASSDAGVSTCLDHPYQGTRTAQAAALKQAVPLWTPAKPEEKVEAAEGVLAASESVHVAEEKEDHNPPSSHTPHDNSPATSFTTTVTATTAGATAPSGYSGLYVYLGHTGRVDLPPPVPASSSRSSPPPPPLPPPDTRRPSTHDASQSESASEEEQKDTHGEPARTPREPERVEVPRSRRIIAAATTTRTTATTAQHAAQDDQTLQRLMAAVERARARSAKSRLDL